MADAKHVTQSITHVQLAHPDDVKRIGELGIYVAFTYVWAVPGLEYDVMVIPLAFPSMQAAVTRKAEGRVMNAGQRISIEFR